jgi:hypothetical protein
MRFARPVAAAGMLVLLWAAGNLRTGGLLPGLHPLGSAGQVRILRFYASVGSLEAGQTAQLCYGVENAKTVRISPWVGGAAPAERRCVAVVPTRTTHYTIMAEGFDGTVTARSLTLPVAPPPTGSRRLRLAGWEAPQRNKGR